MGIKIDMNFRRVITFAEVADLIMRFGKGKREAIDDMEYVIPVEEHVEWITVNEVYSYFDVTRITFKFVEENRIEMIIATKRDSYSATINFFAGQAFKLEAM